MTALCLRTWANIDCIGLRTFSLMFVAYKLQLLTVSEMIVAYQKYPQKELVANVLCCDDSVPQSSNWNERSQFKDQRDQKINHKDQERSKDQRSSCFTDQRIKVHQRSKIMKINWRSSSFRSEIKSSKFNFSQIRSSIWS